MRKTALKRIVSMSGDEGTGGCAPQPTEPDKRARRDNGSAVKASSIDPTPPARCASGGCAPPPVEALSDEERPPLATGGSVPRPVVSVALKGPQCRGLCLGAGEGLSRCSQAVQLLLMSGRLRGTQCFQWTSR